MVPPGLLPANYSGTPLTRTDIACQLAVNLVDYIDFFTVSTIFTVTLGGANITYYGYEPAQPMVFISKFAKAEFDDNGNPEYAYAIELYNPGTVAVSVIGWVLDINGVTVTIPAGTQAVPAGSTLVLHDTTDAVADPSTIFGIAGTNDSVTGIAATGFPVAAGERITLLDTTGFPVDAIEADVIPSFAAVVGVPDDQYIERGDWIIDNAMPVWDTTATWDPSSIGVGTFIPTSPLIVGQIELEGRDDGSLPTVGEMLSVLAIGASGDGTTYKTLPEWFDTFSNVGRTNLSLISDGRIEAGHPDFQGILRFVTVDNFAPFNDFEDIAKTIPLDNEGNGSANDPFELEVAGRININTAPWFVIAQLPWIQDPDLNNGDADKFKLANAIVAYRDKINLSLTFDTVGGPDYMTESVLGANDSRFVGMGSPPGMTVREELGFASIGELVNVTNSAGDVEYDIRKLGKDGGSGDNVANIGPYYQPVPDTIIDELDERDVIFHRVSNLATVRSDVFTAYILVRVGEFGPQKRAIAIFDRTNVFGPGDTPKLVALHPVADPN